MAVSWAMEYRHRKRELDFLADGRLWMGAKRSARPPSLRLVRCNPRSWGGDASLQSK